MTVHGPDAIVLAPGHTITRSGVDAKKKELDDLPMRGVLDKVDYIRSITIKAAGKLDGRLFDNTADSKTHRDLAAQKNWPKADKMFLDALAVTPSNYTAEENQLPSC